MTKEDALLYFPIEEGDDIDDLFEQLLFEQKQFLSNQMPISKVFNSRLNRLKKIEEAYLFFGGNIERNSNEDFNISPYISNSIEKNYNIFQQNKTILKLALFNALNVTEIENVIKHIFKTYIEFAEKWTTIEAEGLNRPIISKEPDAMAIMDEIKILKSKEIVNFSELSQLGHDNILVQESIRLSLWLNLEKHV